MESYYPISKMKRKELDDVNDEFSDFSLSSPARKIRRLDAELPPIIEEEEPDIPIEFEQPELEQSFGSNGRRGLVIEELPNLPENEERALVVFKPVNTPLMQSPSNFSVSVDPQFMSGLKKKALWRNQSNLWRSSDNEPTEQDNKSGSTDKCLAVVPWVPTQFPSVIGSETSQTDLTDMMEAEEMEGVTMDVEDGSVGMDQRTGLNMNEGLHQWQQQHCLIPEPPQNVSAPVVWYQ